MISGGIERDKSHGMGLKSFNPIQDGSFWGCSRIGGGQKGLLHKICHNDILQ